MPRGVYERSDAARASIGRSKRGFQHSAESRARMAAAKVGNLINLVHGHARSHRWTPTYRSWVSAKTRTTNPNSNRWPRYGGRGIRMCEAWLTFEHFLRDMGERPIGTSLDRINNDGDYEPGNCRWATRLEQARNKSAA